MAGSTSTGGVNLVDESHAKQKVRIIIADDDDMTRVLLAYMFCESPDIEIVGEASDGKTAVELTRALLPDAVIMDVGMPHMSGIDASRVIHAEHPEIRVIALSMFEETEMGREMKEAGAVGYFCKNEPWSETIKEIYHVLSTV